MSFRSRSLRGQRAWVALGALFFALPASARVEVVSWSHVEPCSVERFELRYGDGPSTLDTVVDVGRPRQAGGHFSYELEVPDGQETWVCVAAVRGGEVSDCSTPIALDASSDDDLRSEPAPGSADRSWCDDFTGAGLHAGWASTGEDSSLDEATGLFRLASVSQASALVTSLERDDVHSHFLGTDVSGSPSSQWSAYEYSGQMLFSETGGGVGVTLYSQFTAASSYYRLGRHPGTGRFTMDRDRTEPSYKCVDEVQPSAVSPSQWYAFRVRLSDQGTQTTLRAKVWRADRREPEGFQIVCVDPRPTRQVAGAVGVWATGSGTKAWDSLNVSVLSGPDESDPLGMPGQPELVIP